MTQADDDQRIAACIKRIKQARAGGDGFASFDLALKAVRRFPRSLALAYQAALQAARIGALSEATRLFAHYDIAGRVAAGERDPLVPLEDFLALPARLQKDRALENSGPGRAEALRRAARDYLAVFTRTGGTYPLINAASLLDLAGDADDAARYARDTLALLATLPAIADPAEASWRLLTALEAALVLGDMEQVHKAARAAAAAFHGDYGDLSTTIRQLERLVAAKGLDFAVGQALGMPGVLCYSGHIIAAPGADGRFPATRERDVARCVDDFLDNRKVGWAYGSLAAGADIMIAEALLRRGAKVHVVLPFAEAEFIDISVRPSGAAWAQRFQRCRMKVASCRTTVDGGYFGDDALFGACTAYAVGLARLQSQQLGAALTQLLVWDGADGSNTAGTAADHRLGQSVGIASHIIPLPVHAAAQPKPQDLPHPRARRARALIFADVVGFSRIQDDDLPNFHTGIMVPMANTIAALTAAPSIVETWGDAVFLTYDDVEAAAEAAMTLLGALKPTGRDWHLPSPLDLRVSAHFGSAFDITNPFTQRAGCLGTHVSRAARIEPVTPPGVVYVSEAFAAQLALRVHSRYRADFVGTTKLAKQFGHLPVFRLIQGGPQV
jgi:class 3 adenylate cyclase